MVSSVVSANVERLRTLLSTPAIRLVIENFLSLSSIQVLGQLAMLILIPYVTRKIGIEKYGITNFAISFVLFFQFIAVYGFNNTAARKVALHKHDTDYIRRLFSIVSVAKIILCLISGLFYCTFIVVTPSPQFTMYKELFAILFLYVVGEALFPMWLFMGLEKMRFLGIMNVISRILMVICTIIFVQTPDDYILYAAFTSLGFIINGIVGTLIVIFHLRIYPQLPTIHEVMNELGDGLPIFLSLVSIYIYTSCRILILGFFTDESTLGQYVVGERISNALQVFPISALITALIPRLTNLYHTDKTKMLRIMNLLQRGIIIYAIMMLISVFIFAPEMTKVIAGQSFTTSIYALKVLMLSTFIVLANTLRVQYFIISGDFRTFSRIHITWSIIGLIAISILTYFFSYQGLAWAIVGLESGILFTTMTIIRLRGEKI